MLDKKEIRELSKFLDFASVNLYLFENKKVEHDPFAVYELNIDSDIVRQIRTLSKEYIESVLEEAGSLSKIPVYNPDAGQGIFKIASNEVEAFNQLYPYMLGEKPRIPYDGKTVKPEKLKGWIFRLEAEVGGHIEQVLFFQRFQPGKMLGSKGRTIFEGTHGFELLKGNSFHFNLDMDLMVCGGTIIVTKPASFESIFGYDEYYINTATKLVHELAGLKARSANVKVKVLDVADIDKQIAKSGRLARKLSSARANLYFRRINYKKLAALNRKYGFNLKLDHKKRQWTIDQQLDFQVMARILNDDYELSQLTDNEYVALGKEKI